MLQKVIDHVCYKSELGELDKFDESGELVELFEFGELD